MRVLQPAHFHGSSPQEQCARCLKCTNFKWGCCFQPAVKTKYYTMTTMTIALKAGLGLGCRKEQSWRQQHKLSKNRRVWTQEHGKDICMCTCLGRGAGHSKIGFIIILISSKFLSPDLRFSFAIKTLLKILDVITSNWHSICPPCTFLCTIHVLNLHWKLWKRKASAESNFLGQQLLD